MEWLWMWVVGGMVFALIAGAVAWFIYPQRERLRAANAEFYRDPVTGNWTHIPKTRKELWRRS